MLKWAVRIIFLVLMLAAAVHWGAPYIPIPYSEPPISFSGNSTDLKATVIVPTLDTPLPKGQNVIWCSSFQLAWNKLKADIIKEPILLANSQDIADRLNASPCTSEDLPAGTWYADGGFVRDGTVKRIEQEVADGFPVFEVPLFPKLPPEALIAFACLEISAAFTIPYFNAGDPLTFTDTAGMNTDVRAFGIREKDTYVQKELRQQIEVLYREGEPENSWKMQYCLLDLSRENAVQVLVGISEPAETFAQLLENLQHKQDAFKSSENYPFERDIGIADIVLVPEMHWELDHHFRELEGPDKVLLNPGFEGLWCSDAVQTILFKLDRSGAKIASKAYTIYKSAPQYFVFDRPFFIILKQRTAAKPFFVMWVNNAELLSKT